MRIKQDVIVVEMRPRHMPVVVLRLDIQGKHIRNDRIDCLGDRLGLLRLQISHRRQGLRRWIGTDTTRASRLGFKLAGPGLRRCRHRVCYPFLLLYTEGFWAASRLTTPWTQSPILIAARAIPARFYALLFAVMPI